MTWLRLLFRAKVYTNVSILKDLVLSRSSLLHPKAYNWFVSHHTDTLLLTTSNYMYLGIVFEFLRNSLSTNMGVRGGTFFFVANLR